MSTLNRDSVDTIEAHVKQQLKKRGTAIYNEGREVGYAEGRAAALRELREQQAAESPQQKDVHEQPPPKKKKDKRGELVIEGYLDVPSDVQSQLTFYATWETAESRKYENGSRNWLLKIQPMARCFRICCQSNVETFKSKYGLGVKMVKSRVKQSIKECQGCK